MPFLRKVWEDVEPSITTIISDTLRFAVVVLVLVLGFAVFQFLRLLGFENVYIEALKQLHFWGYYAVLATFVGSMVLPMILRLVSGLVAACIEAFRKREK
jgi:hypothetical protein